MRTLTRRFLTSIIVLVAVASFAAAQPGGNLDDLEGILDRLNTTAVLEHARTIAGLGSRLTGYDGYFNTVDYIRNFLETNGLKPELQKFTVIVPWDEGSVIKVSGMEIKAYALWPNGHVGSWSVEGLKGKLVYVGRGELEDFDGVEVEGSIVVMDFESGWNWRNAMKLGAQAVVFVDRGGGDRYEAYSKFEWYAFYPFIRLYVAGGDADKLVELAKEKREAVIDSKLELREVEAYNIIVKLSGRRENEAVAVVASIDSWSVAPALSFNLQDALDVGLLLELVRLAKQVTLERSLWVVLLSGRWQGLAGARVLADSFARDPELSTGRKTVWYVIGVDLSDDHPGVSLLYMGHFYRAGRPLFTAKYSWIQEAVSSRLAGFLRRYLERRNLLPPNLKNAIDALGLVREVDLVEGPDWSWSGTMSVPYLLDTEPFVVAGMPGFTIRTQFSFRNWEGVPGVGSLRWENVLPQFYQASSIIFYAATAETIRLSPSDVVPSRFTGLRGGAGGTALWGLVDFRVSVASFNLSTGWYVPLKGAVVRAWSSHDYPFSMVLGRTGLDGVAKLTGLAPQGVCYWSVDVVKVESDGVYVVDYGVYGVQPTSLVVGALQDPMPLFIPVFKGGVIVLSDVFSPRTFRTGAVNDPRMGSLRAWYNLGREVKVYELETRAEPMFWGVYAQPQDEVALVAAPVGARVVVTVKPENPHVEAKPLILLANSSLSEPEGSGVKVEQGFTFIARPALRYALDLLLTAKNRYEQLKSRMVRRISAELYEERAGSYLGKAIGAYNERRYSEAYRFSLIALSYASRFYADEVMPLYDEAGRTAALMLLLVLPTAFFLERLLVHREGVARIASTAALGVLTVGVFALIHPALTLLTNSAMAIMAVAMLLVTVLLLYVFTSETSTALKSHSEARVGVHEFRREEAAATLMAVTTSLENMRRRPLRTFLTLATISALATAIVALTSTSPTTTTSVSAKRFDSFFEGILIRKGHGVLQDVLNYATVEVLKGLAPNARVSTRLWYYPVSVNRIGPYGLVTSEYGSIAVQGVLGLERWEAEAAFSQALQSGLFEAVNGYACLLTSSQARALGVEPGDEVEFAGFRLTVTGILSDEALQNLPNDPDGIPLAPLDPTYSPELYGFTSGAGQMSPTPLPWSNVLIVSKGFAAKLGAFVNSIAVVPPNVSRVSVEEIAREAAHILDARVTTYVDGTSYTFSRMLSFALFGWESILPLLALGVVNVVTTLLAAVHERTRELYVFSSLGLSPRGAALMFIVEFLVYGFISAFVGYMAGWAAATVFKTAGLLPESYVFNYASFSVLLSMTAVLVVCLAAVAYPALQASKLITPSLERVWRPPTRPKGDTWEVVFPLRLTSRGEAVSLLNYLREYYLGAGYYKSSYRVSSVSDADLESLELKLRILLAPIESGTEQEVSIKVIEQPGRKFTVSVLTRYLGGSRAVWMSSTPLYFDDLRKQLLLWASIPGGEKAKYVSRV